MRNVIKEVIIVSASYFKNMLLLSEQKSKETCGECCRFCYAGGVLCQENQNAPVLIPDALSWLMAGSVRHMRKRRTAATKSTSATPRQEDGTAELGRGSVTVTSKPILCAKNVNETENLLLPKKYTTLSL